MVIFTIIVLPGQCFRPTPGCHAPQAAEFVPCRFACYWVCVSSNASAFAVSSTKIGWVDWQELGWRVESACKSWIRCWLECWKAEHYFTAMPCVWQKGPKYPHLSDVGIRIWPLPWNYAGSLLPFWCAGIPISRIQCQGTLHVPLLLPVPFCLQILVIYHVYTMYIRSIWLTFFVP